MSAKVIVDDQFDNSNDRIFRKFSCYVLAARRIIGLCKDSKKQIYSGTSVLELSGFN